MRFPPLKHRYGVVVYGRRDHYQVQLALHEADALDRVFTDFYAPGWLVALTERFGAPISQTLRLRNHPELSARYFSGDWLKKELVFRYLGLRGHTVAERYHALERLLSRRAAQYASRHPEIGLLCYSYYWSAVAEVRATGGWAGPAIVFQVHPAPSHIKRVIAEDRAATGLTYLPEPEELTSSQADQEYLASLEYADGVIAASSFTAQGLTEDGVPPSRIRVVPYGSGAWLAPVRASTPETRWGDLHPLRLLWVGQLAYRKGAHHLFQAVRRFSPRHVQVSVISRTPVPPELAALIPPNVTFYSSVTDDQRQVMYNTHHLLVLPSLVEGFGLVYLEALLEGLPILATTNTGAPDVVEPGVEGFIVKPGTSDAIVDVIDACLEDSSLLPRMSTAARAAATQWTWARFRAGVRTALASFENSRPD